MLLILFTSYLALRALDNAGWIPMLNNNYHDELETTTQDEQDMNRLRVNAQIFFLCRNVN